MIAIDFAHSFHYRVACRITTCTRHCVQARLSYTRVCICMYIKGRWYLCPCVGLDAKPEDWKEKTRFRTAGITQIIARNCRPITFQQRIKFGHFQFLSYEYSSWQCLLQKLIKCYKEFMTSISWLKLNNEYRIKVGWSWIPSLTVSFNVSFRCTTCDALNDHFESSKHDDWTPCLKFVFTRMCLAIPLSNVRLAGVWHSELDILTAQRSQGHKVIYQ